MTCDDLLCSYFFIPRLKYMKSYIHQIRDYYCACDSDYYDDDDNHNVIFLSQSFVPLKYFIKISKQFLYNCLIIKLKFFYQGREREVAWFALLGGHPLLPPAPFTGFPYQSWKVLEFQGESLKSPWIPFFLEKSLNFCAIPWNVLEFSSAPKVVAWKVFFF